MPGPNQVNPNGAGPPRSPPWYTWWPLGKTKKPKLERHGLTFNPLEVQYAGPYHAKWRDTAQPTPGAMSYAYDTLALPPFDLIWTGVLVTNKPSALPGTPVLANQAVKLQGLPLTAGMIYGQPLFDPNAGYAAPPSIGADFNIPFPRGTTG